ncbi:MAG: hypothetical protein ABSG05_03295 [Candidatus Pacearchaeota archaeon]|jgi:hypothetical protein
MPSEDTIYIKLDYMEALKTRRGILNSELSVLNISKKIQQYKNLRLLELGLKSKLSTKFKDVKSNIRRLQATLPSGRLPKIIQKEKAKAVEKSSERVGRIRQQSDIESQLSEIQRRLAELQGENV